jgi:hypothetical protein
MVDGGSCTKNGEYLTRDVVRIKAEPAAAKRITNSILAVYFLISFIRKGWWTGSDSYNRPLSYERSVRG